VVRDHVELLIKVEQRGLVEVDPGVQQANVVRAGVGDDARDLPDLVVALAFEGGNFVDRLAVRAAARVLVEGLREEGDAVVDPIEVRGGLGLESFPEVGVGGHVLTHARRG